VNNIDWFLGLFCILVPVWVVIAFVGLLAKGVL
jgi:hypothetical protein